MSTSTQQLTAGSWTEYFDSIASRIDGQLVTIEVMSQELGDQTDVERLPLKAIGYDHKDDTLEVSVGGRGPRYPVVFRHFISSPQTISVQESSPLSPEAILITDASGVRTLIRLFGPATLET